jgi:hypothetical protein
MGYMKQACRFSVLQYTANFGSVHAQVEHDALLKHKHK